MITVKNGESKVLSTHFNAKEFKCKCGGSHNISIDENLISMLEKLHTKMNCQKIIVNSGYRCYNHDIAVGGSGNGQHTKGKAADVVCYDQSGQIISSKIISCVAQDLGFTGIANITSAYTSTHLDVRDSGTYKGDETKGTNTVTTDFYKYYNLTKDVVYGTETHTIEVNLDGATIFTYNF